MPLGPLLRRLQGGRTRMTGWLELALFHLLIRAVGQTAYIPPSFLTVISFLQQPEHSRFRWIGAMILRSHPVIASRMVPIESVQKMGVGLDERRLFNCLSSTEGLSQESMQDTDREQRQRCVDHTCRFVKTDPCASRGFSPGRFDTISTTKQPAWRCCG